MKLSIFQEYLIKQDINLAFFFHPDPSITYFTQKNFSYAIFLITPAKATLYLTKLDSFPSLSGITSKFLSKDWEKETSSKKIKKIGVNKSLLSIFQQEKLQKQFPRAIFIDIGEKVNEIRQKKTLEEIKKMSFACSITSAAFSALIQELGKKKLKTELDVALFLEAYIRQQGAELAFPTIVASGKNSATPHHITSLEKLTNGFLQLDFGAKWENYSADMSRVIYLGNPYKKEMKYYDFLLWVQEACIQKVREGKSFAELHLFAQKKLGKLSKFFIHTLGHGIGVEVHELPHFKDPEAKVNTSVPFTIEPGIYFPGKYGLRIEDTLLWNGKKVEILTKATKKLISVSI
ncbi:M24 family metallopeptidase [Candidatus Woesearchaeota archaeon]|nr:M24 family metallopeptidase [Candidatus Woesearchaeota archaeon]